MIEKLRQVLANWNKKCITDSNLISSAVILPIFIKNGDYHVLFVKRTETVRDHKGQISFPGGHYEIQDRTLLNTALRECMEEIGVPQNNVDVLGELDECATLQTGYVISTFVGLIPYPFDFKIDRREISRTIEAPVSALLSEKDCSRACGNSRSVFHYDGEIIWGATAIILSQFLEIWCGLTCNQF